VRVAPERREGDVDDRRVEDRHDRPDHDHGRDRDRDDLAVELYRPPVCVMFEPS